jgi:fructose-bisphosphate aldolase, class II
MVLVSGEKILLAAKKGGYAVGAFNTNDLEITKAIISAAVELNSPIFISISEGALRYGGDELVGLALQFAKEVKIPVAVHLDHGKTVVMAKKCVKLGFSSVMIDGSSLPFWKNAALSKKVVVFAHKKGVSVEAELGQLKGTEDLVSSKVSLYTEPTEAKEFVKIAGIDSLAVAIGTSHGAYKFKGVPKLDLKRLSEIVDLVKIPLVLHGASSVTSDIVAQANKYGANLSEARGVPEAQIRQAVRLGICKVNEDTDLRIAFTAAVRKSLKENPKLFDPREMLSPAVDMMRSVVERRIRLLGSEGKV